MNRTDDCSYRKIKKKEKEKKHVFFEKIFLVVDHTPRQILISIKIVRFPLKNTTFMCTPVSDIFIFSINLNRQKP